MRFVELRADSDNPVLLDLHSIRKVEIMGTKAAEGDKDYRMVKITQEGIAAPTVVELSEWAKLREWLLDVR